MKGEKSLSRSAIYQVASALNLKKKEQDYFSTLVFFNESKTLEEKNLFYSQLLSYSKLNEAALLHKDQYQYFSNWYNAAIREIVTYADFQEDYRALGNLLNPAITEKMAKDSVELLLRLKLIQKKDGQYHQTNEIVTTGDEVFSLAVQNFQKENLKLAERALEKFRDEKDISTITFGTNLKGYKQIRNEIISFRKRVLKLITAHKPMDRVYQINFQIFPLSNVSSKDNA
jgi:uncharacterized protein (TIGR02147 family)